jgi:hypothetical protein
MKRWLAVLSPVTMFGVMSGHAPKNASPRAGGGDARHLIGLNRWETEWAANGADLLRILKAL